MKYEINIPKPCNENWNTMIVAEKGRFCANCTKEVVDFTMMSKKQLLSSLKKGEKLCGRFRKEQLNTEIKTNQSNSISNIAASITIASLLLGTEAVNAQNSIPKIEKVISPNDSLVTKYKKEPVKEVITIKGNIFDQSGGLPGSKVVLKGTRYTTETDFDGNFSLEVSKDSINKSILVFSFLGYKTQEEKFNVEKPFVKVQMIEEEELLGEIVFIEKENFFQRIGNWFKGKNKKECKAKND